MIQIDQVRRGLLCWKQEPFQINLMMEDVPTGRSGKVLES